MGKQRAAIYKADTWHVDDGVSTDGSGLPLHHNRRDVFTAEYKLAILAEGVHAFPHDAAGTIELKDAEVALQAGAMRTERSSRTSLSATPNRSKTCSTSGRRIEPTLAAVAH